MDEGMDNIIGTFLHNPIQYKFTNYRNNFYVIDNTFLVYKTIGTSYAVQDSGTVL